MDVGSRWKPPSGSGDSGDLSGAPKRKLKNLNEVLQNEAVIGKHVTYHVPPGKEQCPEGGEAPDPAQDVIVQVIRDVIESFIQSHNYIVTSSDGFT